MKILLLFSLPLALSVTSCKLFGTNPAPPSKVEQAVFNTVTNYVTVERPVTNVVTTVVQIPVQTTNTVNQVIVTTNTVTQFATNVTQVTVTNEEYTLTPKPVTTTLVQSAGTLGNLAMPGVGTLASNAVLLALGIWAQWRSTKRQATSVTLTQEIEAVREFIKTLPQGVKYYTAITKFLQDHQVEAGVAQQVIDILTKEKLTTAASADAKANATDIQATVTKLA